jgi:hypothetical protein
MHDGTQSTLLELQDWAVNQNQALNGISYGELAVGQERWMVRVPVYREVSQASDNQGNSVSDQHVTEFQVELLKCSVESKDEPLNEEFCAANLEKLTHKELLKQAIAAGVDAQTVASYKHRTGSFHTNALIEKIVRAEVERPKGKVPTVIARYRLGTLWHRYSHFINLHNALASCVSKKDRKKIPRVLQHERHAVFGHHGHLLEERRKHLEKFMLDLLNHGTLQPQLNPYFLGFLGMFVESDEDVEANELHFMKTRQKLRLSVHEATVLSTLQLTNPAGSPNDGLEIIREVDRAAPYDTQPEPEPKSDRDLSQSV